MLRELLRQPLRFTPIFEVIGRGARFEDALENEGMLAGWLAMFVTRTVASPEGCERVTRDFL